VTLNTSGGGRLQPARPALPRPVWLLGWVSFFTDMASEMIYPLLPLFLTRVLGASALSLGIIEGIADAANSALKIVSGRLADKTGRPKRLVLAGYGLSSAVRPLMALASTWTQVLLVRFSDRLGKGIRGAPRDAMLAEFAPPERRGRVYGFHRAMDHAGAVLGPLVAAVFLYFQPGEYRTLFALTIVPGLIVIFILLRVPEAARQLPTSNSQLPTGAAFSPGPMPATLWRALAVVTVFGLGNASDAFLLLRLSDAGVAPFWIPLVWSGLHVVKVVSSAVGGELSDRFGRRALIAAGWLYYAGVYALFAIVDAPALLIAVFLGYGVYFGLTEGVEKAWIADLAPHGARGTAFGYYNAALGISALLASLLFGAIWSRVSADAAFITGALLAGAATLLLYFLFPHEKNIGHKR
jgi:MFS family permease